MHSAVKIGLQACGINSYMIFTSDVNNLFRLYLQYKLTSIQLADLTIITCIWWESKWDLIHDTEGCTT